MAHTAFVGAGPASGTLARTCGGEPGIACRLAWDLTHSTGAAQLVRVYLAGPVSAGLKIVFVIVVAAAVRAVAHRVINRVTERAATATLPVAPIIHTHRAAHANEAGQAEDTAPTEDMEALEVAEAGTERREQRARALGSILRSGVSIVVFGIAALTILGDLGFNLTPPYSASRSVSARRTSSGTTWRAS